MRALRLAAVSCVCVATGCASPDAPSTIVRERLYAMGTWVDVAFQSDDEAVALVAIADIERMLREFERDYYPWAQGALADLNAAFAAGRATNIDPAARALLQRAQRLSGASGRYFDPGIGALVELWGFDSSFAETREPPTDTDIAAVLAAIGDGFFALDLGAEQIRSGSPALKIDLGGIAKGAAVERCVEILERYGIGNALVNAGGDLFAVGRAPGDRAWRIGIRHSRLDSTIGVIQLGAREAAFTSGDYERFFEHDGQRLHHLLDPTTGRPATHTQALTVLANDPVLADAAATALFVAGPERWRGVAEKLGISEVLRVDADGTIEMTPAMSARVQLSTANHDIIAGPARE